MPHIALFPCLLRLLSGCLNDFLISRHYRRLLPFLGWICEMEFFNRERTKIKISGCLKIFAHYF
ncbi:MAG: hypothetical protein IIU35_00015 [Neisseriaceae bacterium]|nr:hypothetical protein [Neisseriaceae bacterium]